MSSRRWPSAPWRKPTYSTDNIGHYGLAFPYYTHFTSPIRRYPDMMVHRLLARYLAGGKSARHNVLRRAVRTLLRHGGGGCRGGTYIGEVQDGGVHGGQDWQEFDGVISGVTEWGVYVELDDTHIEGMVSTRDITDDVYSFDEENYALRGHRTGRAFTLGDGVRIKVLRADLMHKQLDFALTATYDFETKQATPVLVAPPQMMHPQGVNRRTTIRIDTPNPTDRFSDLWDLSSSGEEHC